MSRGRLPIADRRSRLHFERRLVALRALPPLRRALTLTLLALARVFVAHDELVELQAQVGQASLQVLFVGSNPYPYRGGVGAKAGGDALLVNAELDGQAGIQELAGNATLLYYLSEEAKEGKNAFIEKRDPDWSKYPKFP